MKNSKNLDKFRSAKRTRHYTNVYLLTRDDAGNLVTEWEPHHIYIGVVDDISLGGARLSAILRGDFETWAYPIAPGEVVEITTEFWEQYEQDGRCTFDRSHSTYFLDAADRFTVVNQTQCCNWCGKWPKPSSETIVPAKRVAVWALG